LPLSVLQQLLKSKSKSTFVDIVAQQLIDECKPNETRVYGYSVDVALLKKMTFWRRAIIWMAAFHCTQYSNQ
jgi:hypothetical protein